jgi:hypothetical protein
METAPKAFGAVLRVWVVAWHPSQLHGSGLDRHPVAWLRLEDLDFRMAGSNLFLKPRA